MTWMVKNHTFFRIDTKPVDVADSALVVGSAVVVGSLVVVGSTVVVVSEIYKITICYGICQQCNCAE